MTYYDQVKQFHQVFDNEQVTQVRELTGDAAKYRATFKFEEILEFLYAASNGDDTIFREYVSAIHQQIDQQADKIMTKKVSSTNRLVGEVDALIDLLYFTFGTFVKMGIDPKPLFDIVHTANMGKLFPDGKPHYHPVTGKVLKPDNWEHEYAPEAKILKEINQQKNKHT
ncbi:HAD family hydrolase [Vagococcus penaei]|uniref:HAD family hydrolase n=1 Tax=Vagococcus penaei TaxID=633807 RepID=A0A1Q2D7T2_9ENTE|nr:HAD family hydrolase [Vagococcus penaei]AQP54375.1 HAD family hydrolase [Vagococcus penaei]RSU06290.1 HAD family hydrolase [Vagococcus penaei]